MKMPPNLSRFDKALGFAVALFAFSLWLGPVVSGIGFLSFALDTFPVYFLFGSTFWLAATIYLVAVRHWWSMLLTVLPLLYPWIALAGLLSSCFQGNCI